MKRDKLRIGVITAALAMMIAGGVLTWQQDARNGKADQAKQGETAQLTEDESTGTTEQQTEETAGAVSYTHLDVYKRQQVHPLRFRHPLLLGTVQSRYRIPARRRRLHRRLSRYSRFRQMV